MTEENKNRGIQEAGHLLKLVFTEAQIGVITAASVRSQPEPEEMTRAVMVPTSSNRFSELNNVKKGPTGQLSGPYRGMP